MSTRSLTRIYDSQGAELLCLYRHSDGYPEGHGAELAAACNVRIVNGMSDDGLDQANGMGCLAARIVAFLKVSWKNPYEDLAGMAGMEKLAARKAPYVEPGNLSIVPVGTTGCWEEYEYHVKFRQADKDKRDSTIGSVVISCYAVEGGYKDSPRELFPLAVDVEPSKFSEEAAKGVKQNNLRQAATSLHATLKDKPWFLSVFLSVGVGADELIVMAKSKPPKGEVPEEYDEIPVKLRVTGKLKPA